MPLNDPYLGHPSMIINPSYQYEFSEMVDSDVNANQFQPGVTVRNARSSRKRRTFKVVFKTVKWSLMNDLERFYRDVNGLLKPFWFKPPTELVSGRYAQLVLDGSQKLEDFESTQLRAGDQSVLVRFTQPFNRTLFKPLLESTGLILEEVFGEVDPGKYIQFDGLSQGQYAIKPDYSQDYLDLGTKDFMIDFMIRGETIFTSTSASYAAMTGLTLIFTIDGTPYTVTFTAGATDAATTCQEINDQQGDKVRCQVFGTTELKIVTLIDSGFFAISGTAFAQLNLSAGILNPISKELIGSTGYKFLQNEVSSFRFGLSDGVTPKVILADSSFHVFDGAWHHMAVACDRSANGQMYADGVASGSAVDISAVGSLDNATDFLLNSDENLLNQGNFQMDNVRIWTWDAGSLPTDIATKILNIYESWFNKYSLDVADESGVQVMHTFDDETGDDSVQSEDLTLINDPDFFDYDQ